MGNKIGKKENEVDLIDPRSAAFADEIIRRLSSEKNMKDLLSKSPGLRSKIVQVITKIEKHRWKGKENIRELYDIDKQFPLKQEKIILTEENNLIHKINTVFSADDRQRYNELYIKFQKKEINESEKEELLELSDSFEVLNAERLKYIGELALLRNQTLRKTINDLEIKMTKQTKNYHVETDNYEGSRKTP